MTGVIVIGGADQGRQVIDAVVARGFHTVVGVLDRALPARQRRRRRTRARHRRRARACARPR